MDRWVVMGSDVGYMYAHICYRQLQQLWSLMPERYLEAE